MIEPLIDFFERLISDFSWKRLTFVLSVLGIIFASLWLYESYTATFKLDRMDKQLTLLERMSSLADKEIIQKDGSLDKAFSNLSESLGRLSTESESTFVLSNTSKKAIAAAIPWIFLYLFIFFVGRDKSDLATTAAGMVIVAIPFIVAGALLPDYSNSWINYWGYPIVHCAIVVALVMSWDKRKKKRLGNDA